MKFNIYARLLRKTVYVYRVLEYMSTVILCHRHKSHKMSKYSTVLRLL